MVKENDEITTSVLQDATNFINNPQINEEIPVSPDNDKMDCDWSESGVLSLVSLPPEIFMHICAFIDAKFVIKTLSLVCKSFHALLSSNSTWKIRIGKRWPKRYPPIPVNDSEFNWKQACIVREESHKTWSGYPDTVDTYIFREGLYASVDSVHLMKGSRFLAVGSRDRYLNLLDLSHLEPGNPSSITNCKVWSHMKAHKGWIWSIASHDNILATGSWDTYIKFWDLQANGEEIHKIKCKSAMLCTHYEENMLFSGGYDKNVYHIDPRTPQIVAEKKYHRQPVLALVADQHNVITGSEDGTVAVYDRRAASVVKTIQFDQYPMSLSYGQDQLWVGDKTGKLHLLDATDGDFLSVANYDVGHSGKLTGVIHTMGAIFTCSTDKSVKILEPNLDPAVIKTIDGLGGEIAEIAYGDEVLIGACSDASVVIWKPKPEC